MVSDASHATSGRELSLPLGPTGIRWGSLEAVGPAKHPL